MLPQLATPHSGACAGSSSRSCRRNGLEYVEGVTRRHLETVQGLEMSEIGEVRDGDWQGNGSGLGKGRLEGLERVVSMLRLEAGVSHSRRGDEVMDES